MLPAFAVAVRVMRFAAADRSWRDCHVLPVFVSPCVGEVVRRGDVVGASSIRRPTPSGHAERQRPRIHLEDARERSVRQVDLGGPGVHLHVDRAQAGDLCEVHRRSSPHSPGTSSAPEVRAAEAELRRSPRSAGRPRRVSDPAAASASRPGAHRSRRTRRSLVRREHRARSPPVRCAGASPSSDAPVSVQPRRRRADRQFAAVELDARPCR